MPLDLNLILPIIAVGTCMWLMLGVSRPLREEARKLTPDQARIFDQTYRRPVTLAACAASAASIAAYIFIGG